MADCQWWKDQVQLRFAYRQAPEYGDSYSHYFWGIDDIKVVANEVSNDLQVTQVTNANLEQEFPSVNDIGINPFEQGGCPLVSSSMPNRFLALTTLRTPFTCTLGRTELGAAKDIRSCTLETANDEIPCEESRCANLWAVVLFFSPEGSSATGLICDWPGC